MMVSVRELERELGTKVESQKRDFDSSAAWQHVT